VLKGVYVSQITAPTPVYEAMLALATDHEREVILAAGPREHLDSKRMFCRGEEHDAAIAAFGEMKSILRRVTSGVELCVTGIDPRMMPPRRESLDPDLVHHGVLVWTGPGGCMSRLLLTFLFPIIHIADLRIEPTGQPAAEVRPAMSRSRRLVGGERIDDSSRLSRMQRFIDEGDRPKTAARKAAIAEPHPHSTEEATTSRLSRKFRERATQ
jgi:hypothetical protein